MRILFVTDTHLRGNSPQNRLDDFPATQKTKLAEVVEIARQRQVELVIHGGDLWETPNPSLSVCGEYLAVLRDLPVPLLAVPGNHDIFGHNPETLPRTMLGFLERLGWLRLLRPGAPVEWETQGVRVRISGQPFHHQIDRRTPDADYVVPAAEADATIHVVHGMLLERPLPQLAAYTLIDDIMHTGAQVTLAGHYHLGLGAVEAGGRYFVNPGALVRISNHPDEMERWPRVALVEVGTGGRVQVELVDLKGSLPGAQVLDRTRLEARLEREQRLTDFVNQVRATGNHTGLDLQAVVQNLAAQSGVPAGVREEALRRLQAVQERLERGEEELE